MRIRGWLTAALIVTVGATMSADPAAARSKALDLLDDRLTHKNFPTFDAKVRLDPHRKVVTTRLK